MDIHLKDMNSNMKKIDKGEEVSNKTEVKANVDEVKSLLKK